MSNENMQEMNFAGEQEQKNEVMQVNKRESYEVSQTADGKYVRKAVYTPFTSVHPETREQKIKMLALLNGDDENTQALGEHIGAHIDVADVIFNPYDKINEDTGEIEFGVLTYLITPEGVVYVTSSKSVYFSMKRVFQVFGEPHWEGEDVITVKVVKKPGQNFKYTDIQIVG
jgi:hypothetical protein